VSQSGKRPRIGIIAIAVLIVAAAAIAIGVAGRAGTLETTARELGEFESLRVSAGSIPIEIAGAQGTPRLEASLDTRRELIVTEDGGALAVEVSENVGIFRLPRQEIIRLLVPEGTRTEIDSGSGSVEVDGVDFSQLVVDTGSGSVAIARSSAVVKIDVGSGSVDLTDVAGELTISSGSGSLSGDGVRLTGDSSFDTGSGSIDMVFLNSEDELAFDLDSGSGSIRVGGVKGADRVRLGSGEITVRGSSGSGSQEYRTR